MFCENCGYENADGDKFCRRCGHALAQEAPAQGGAPAAGGRLGPYEILGELGRGAMACVWRAWDPRLRREVAIKEPLFDPRLPETVLTEMGRRFVAEGVAAARLNHPNIVTIHEADVFEGRPAIVMELVEGATLAQLLEAGPLDPRTASHLLDQLIDAVGYAHAQGIVHRDIKPDNVFVTSDWRVKLADFGIAHVDDGNATRATVAGAVLGTPGYMSPEQIRGQAVDGRSDLFSIGVVAYEMLTGHNPFGAGEGADVTTILYRVVGEPVPDLPAPSVAGLPASFAPALMAALAKDPADRPQTAAELKAMLSGERAAPAAPVPEGVGARGGMGASSGTGPGVGTGSGKRQGGAPSWLPYVLVAGVGVAVLVVVLLSALQSPAGGSAPVAADAPAVAMGEPTSPNPGETGEEGEGGEDNPKKEPEGGVTSNPGSDTEPQAPQGQYPPVFTDAEASSTLPDDIVGSKTYSYVASNVLNFDDRDIAWNEGVSGAGVGEWIRVFSSNPQLVAGFNILPGYAYSQDRYYHNHRPKTVQIELSDGYTATVSLSDDPCQWQTVTFDTTHATTYLKLTITDVYYSDGRYDDNCITAIQAF